MRPIILTTLLTALVFIGCGDDRPDLPTVPISYSGLLPCDDCKEIDVTLTLMSDSLFLMRQEFVTAGETNRTRYVDFGEWEVDADGNLVLHRGTEPPRLYRITDDKLSQLDNLEKEVLEGHELSRTEEAVDIRDSFMMRGMYSHYATMATLVECQTMRELPVAVEGDDSLLQAAYANTDSATVDTVLVAFYGHIQPTTELEDADELLVIDSIVDVWPDMICTDNITAEETETDTTTADTTSQ